MSTRRAARVDDGATVKLIRSVTPPLSSSRKHPSPSNPLHSDKENVNNRRRSTSRESASNPTQKPVIRPVPRISTSSVSRGRTPSPTEFHKIHRVSVDRVAMDPTHGKGKTDLNKSKVQTRSRSSFDGNGSSKSEFKYQSDGNKKNESVKSNKYQSKLHEKLAFLEGKVKRIASDIKKTKEMLDMNNPDASKVILSDIQDKISGIEKAMVHVVTTTTHDDDDGVVDEKKNKQLGMVDKSVSNDGFQGGEGKSFVKGLNSEELEARLFPHHKLIRDRTLIKGKDDDNCSVVKPMVEDKVLSPVDHNSIAMEFLDSLGNEKSKVSVSTRECEVQETGGGDGNGRNKVWENNEKCDIDLLLQANEILEELDEQENKMEGQGQGQGEFVGDEMDEAFNFKLNEIGNKIAAAGWFLSEGEAVLLAHDDASCSYYDITNCEEKAVYLPPPEVSPNMWRDCWVIRAHGYDGCSGRFVVAASAGNTMDSGFCSWDFYTKEVRAFQMERGTTSSRSALRPLPNNIVQRRSSESSIFAPEARQCWYKPCGNLIISTASSQRAVKVFDVRDGEQIMTWDVQNPVIAMEYSSPLQWRNRGKIVVAEAETISLWDVNSPSPQALLSVPLGGRKVSALHVSNTDAELGGGVRRRVSSSEAEGNDGVFCTSDSINVLDFRQPSGVGLRISKHGDNVQSVFCRGDSVFLGCSSSSSMGKKQSSSVIQQFSLRRGGLFSTYALPESNTNSHAAISQVWGNSEFVMGVCGLGLCVFDALKNDALRELKMDYSNAQSLREVVGPDNLYCPSFDYLGSRALLISRDRPAMWRHLIV
ncbi:KIN14B-interacting protein At4g14310 [Gastrolobium bilobum]|uniref:KIN14B-interacting protein At4g14310 n=1 Tax=Gastrolobium bilobum TaxID=150636 RepID=UPI002AB0C8BB|nr:KIN14B-interacting protein At4g14310 [Gastrolobium bilobum]